MKNFENSVLTFCRASSTRVALFCLLAVGMFTVPVEAQKESRRGDDAKSSPSRVITPFKQAMIDADRQLSGGPVDFLAPIASSGLVPNANPSFIAYDFGLDQLVFFTAADPSTVTTVEITGLDAANNERLEFIDSRPANGGLYAIARKQGSLTDDICRVVTINTSTGAVTTVGTPSNCGTDPLFFGGDFNPVVDLIRETDRNDGNRRWSPTTGALVGTDGTLIFASGDTNFGNNPSVVHVAYTNNFAGATSTTLYGLDETSNSLVTIVPASGELSTVGSTGVNFANFGGFDIQPGTNLAYAVLLVNSTSTLYSIDLATGVATELGVIGDGSLVIDGLTVSAGGAEANLAITKTDGFDTYVPGSVRPYTIVATNNGPDPVSGAIVSDPMTAQFSAFSWTCTGSGGGTCPASGTGSINAFVNIPVGGSVTFLLNATVAPGTSGPLVNTATISAPAGVADASSGNNSAADSNTLLTTSSGVIVSGRVMTPDGRGLRGAPVTIISPDGIATTVTTSSLGYYTFSEVDPGSTYVIGVSSRRYRFTSRVIQVADNLLDVDFIGLE